MTVLSNIKFSYYSNSSIDDCLRCVRPVHLPREKDHLVINVYIIALYALQCNYSVIY